jgi:hypothetical protein
MEAPEKMILCVAFDQNTKAGDGGMRSYKDSMLYSSEDWFKNKKYVDMGIGKRARGVVGLGVVSKFMVAALKVPDDPSKRASGGDPMYVTPTPIRLSLRRRLIDQALVRLDRRDQLDAEQVSAFRDAGSAGKVSFKRRQRSSRLTL